ncbi:branched-chain amino acid ABC transporter permease [Vineibacter terrae]|uniref:branched-chain amino acid ABC transporter permease n=1 Tax=Vineibacter terrae TaxID=2586908 RepID=UPI002E37184A|nr:branched-chain amino acid ABC transporter permease [Vineibacter terrae]HEX2891866.1 branched-chain amino acid ABC transporter permease [Vineibacter terrae]
MMGTLSYVVFFVTVASLFAIATLGLNLQWGFSGQFNAGVVGFMAIGAYTYAALTAPAQHEHVGGLDWPVIAAVAAAMAVTALVALAIGLVTIRLRTDYLALATFGIAAAINHLALNLEGITGGGRGIAGIAKPFADLPPLWFGLAFLALATGALLAVYLLLERLVRSPWGRALRAVREDEVAAAALGKDVDRMRLTAFVIGAAPMGLSGALYAAFIGYVSPYDFLAILTFQIWAMLIVGGSGNNAGAVLGSFVVWALWSLSGIVVVLIVPTKLQVQGGAIQAILIGLLLVAMLIFRPRGLMGERLHSSPLLRDDAAVRH